MTIDPSVVGRALRGLSRDVSWRDTTNYAAAVGETAPCYLDDTREGGLVAPPLFAVALTWPLFADIPGRLEGGFPAEILATMVHAAEHLRFHAPVRPGECVDLEGRVVAAIPGPSGTRVVLRVDASAGGEPRFTGHTTALFRGVGCAGDGARAGDLPDDRPPDPAPRPSWEAAIPIGREAPFVYDGCTGISFPIHTSVAFARAVGLPDLLVQGTYTLALAAREIVAREAGGDPGRLLEIACRFTGMVVPGTGVRVQATGRQDGPGEGLRLGFRVLDDRGVPAIDRGLARLAAGAR